jgi:hypothetical protein
LWDKKREAGSGLLRIEYVRAIGKLAYNPDHALVTITRKEGEGTAK